MKSHLQQELHLDLAQKPNSRSKHGKHAPILCQKNWKMTPKLRILKLESRQFKSKCYKGAKASCILRNSKALLKTRIEKWTSIITSMAYVYILHNWKVRLPPRFSKFEKWKLEIAHLMVKKKCNIKRIQETHLIFCFIFWIKNITMIPNISFKFSNYLNKRYLIQRFSLIGCQYSHQANNIENYSTNRSPQIKHNFFIRWKHTII